jgi:hypothetical protein
MEQATFVRGEPVVALQFSLGVLVARLVHGRRDALLDLG